MAKKKEAKKEMKGFFSKSELMVMKEQGKFHKKQTAERLRFMASYGHYQEVLKSMKSACHALEVYYKHEKDSPLDKSLDVPEINRFQKKFQKESAALLKALTKSM